MINIYHYDYLLCAQVVSELPADDVRLVEAEVVVAHAAPAPVHHHLKVVFKMENPLLGYILQSRLNWNEIRTELKCIWVFKGLAVMSVMSVDPYCRGRMVEYSYIRNLSQPEVLPC